MRTRIGAVAALVVGLLAGATADAEGPPKVEQSRTVYVPLIKADLASRHEALRMRELLIKSIERETSHKVVGSPEGADLVLEATLKSVARPGR